MLQADAGANHDDDENGNDDGGNTQGAAELSVAGCSWEQQEVVVPDAADEHEAALVEDKDANNSEENDRAAVVNVQVPESLTICHFQYGCRCFYAISKQAHNQKKHDFP